MVDFNYNTGGRQFLTWAIPDMRGHGGGGVLVCGANEFWLPLTHPRLRLGTDTTFLFFKVFYYYVFFFRPRVQGHLCSRPLVQRHRCSRPLSSTTLFFWLWFLFYYFFGFFDRVRACRILKDAMNEIKNLMNAMKSLSQKAADMYIVYKKKRVHICV